MKSIKLSIVALFIASASFAQVKDAKIAPLKEVKTETAKAMQVAPADVKAPVTPLRLTFKAGIFQTLCPMRLSLPNFIDWEIDRTVLHPPQAYSTPEYCISRPGQAVSFMIISPTFATFEVKQSLLAKHKFFNNKWLDGCTMTNFRLEK